MSEAIPGTVPIDYEQESVQVREEEKDRRQGMLCPTSIACEITAS